MKRAVVILALGIAVSVVLSYLPPNRLDALGKVWSVGFRALVVVALTSYVLAAIAKRR